MPASRRAHPFRNEMKQMIIDDDEGDDDDDGHEAIPIKSSPLFSCSFQENVCETADILFNRHILRQASKL
jgi:hypothetical protein